MTDIVLNNITSGYNISKINSNFDAIKNSINNDILNLSGDNNILLQDIDLNSNNLLNVSRIDTKAIFINDNPVILSSLTTIGPGVIGAVQIDPTYESNLAKVSDLSSTEIGKGSQLIGFLQDGVDAIAQTVQDRLRETVHASDFGAVADYDPVTDTGTDNTNAFNAAIAYLVSVGGGTLRIGRGNYLGHITITNRYIRVIGEGRWSTTIYNAIDSAIFTINNSTNSITDVSLEGVTLRNRNKTTYINADGISIIGSIGANSCDFLTFRDLYIFQMRNNISIIGRTIWNLWERVACAEAIFNNLNVNATDNPAQQTFIQCRFGVAGQHGILVNSAFAAFPVVGWTFIGCTIERNLYNGVRVTGTGGGIQAWTFTGCYFEENTYGLLANAGTSALQKAHIFIDCPNVFGFALNQCSMFGASAGHTNLDYHVYMNSGIMTSVTGSVANCRFGVSTINDIYWPRGVQLGPNTYTSPVNIDRSSQSIDVRDFTNVSTNFTPTLTFGGGSNGITYSNRVGKYVRHGNMVFFTVYIALTSKGTSTGVASITGLPIASQPTAGNIQTLAVHADQFVSGITNLQSRVLPNTTVLQINKFAAGASTATADTDFGNFSAISISGSYMVL